MMQIDYNTPLSNLTVGELMQLLGTVQKQELPKQEKKYVYGVAGLARLFDCSMATATRIKASGKIDAAIKQIGRKIIVDAEHAIELAGKKKGGRNR